MILISNAVAPAQMAISYTVKEEAPMLPDNVLTGPPGPEADKAWEELEKREFNAITQHLLHQILKLP